MTIEQQEAYRFLLGEVDAKRAEEIETSMFADDAVFESLSVFEDELIEAYLAGELPPQRRERFENRLLPEERIRTKIATARALVREAQADAETSWVQRLRAWLTPRRAMFPLAGAVAVIALLVMTVIPEDTARLSLASVGVRGPDDIAQIDLSYATKLELELALGDVPARTDWTVVVADRSEEIWRGPPKRADAIAVQVAIPTARFTPGRWEVRLLAGGEEIVVYEMDVQR